MDIAMIGLGRMGTNMAKRLIRGGHRVVVYDINPEAVQAVSRLGGEPASSLEQIPELLDSPRTAWLTVPAGKITEEIVETLADLFSPGDTIIDGGNATYHDSQRRAAYLHRKKIHFIDVGASGGVWGLSEGYSLTIGGEAKIVERHRPLFETLAPSPEKGWGHVGPHGAGHFSKMIHNGIECGLMQAYAEGFEILKAKAEFNYDLHQVAEIWRFGSANRSWLLDLTALTLADNPELIGIKGKAPEGIEGMWTAKEAIDLNVPAPVITLALQMWFLSRQEEHFSGKMLAALRNQVGSH